MDEQTKNSEKKPAKSGAAKIAGIASTVLWVVGFALDFVIPAKTRFTWVPDFLLLIGFWPLLWIWRPGWPWIIFGVLNIAIGFLLEMAYQMPDTNFTTEMKIVLNHMRNMHSSLTWIIIGFISAVFGVIRTIKQIWTWVAAKMKAK
jgi:hypothetical protein